MNVGSTSVDYPPALQAGLLLRMLLVLARKCKSCAGRTVCVNFLTLGSQRSELKPGNRQKPTNKQATIFGVSRLLDCGRGLNRVPRAGAPEFLRSLCVCVKRNDEKEVSLNERSLQIFSISAKLSRRNGRGRLSADLALVLKHFIEQATQAGGTHLAGLRSDRGVARLGLRQLVG